MQVTAQEGPGVPRPPPLIAGCPSGGKTEGPSLTVPSAPEEGSQTPRCYIHHSRLSAETLVEYLLSRTEQNGTGRVL